MQKTVFSDFHNFRNTFATYFVIFKTPLAPLFALFCFPSNNVTFANGKENLKVKKIFLRKQILKTFASYSQISKILQNNFFEEYHQKQ